MPEHEQFLELTDWLHDELDTLPEIRAAVPVETEEQLSQVEDKCDELGLEVVATNPHEAGITVTIAAKHE